jgi:hypothetical protein
MPWVDGNPPRRLRHDSARRGVGARQAQPKKGAVPKANVANAAEVGDGSLFDLAKNPYETADVAAAHPDIVDRLRAEAQRREQEIHEHRRPSGEVRETAK